MDAIRIGNFTSSGIHNLLTVSKDGKDFGKPAQTYIKNKRRERMLKVEIDLEQSARATSWGKALEGYVFQKYMPINYTLASDITDVHEEGIWCGTKDFFSSDTVGDIKCPYTRGSFCDLVDICESNSIEVFKRENPEYYWQLVSNSILTKKPYAELRVFMPKQSEILGVIKYLENIDDFELQKDIQWVTVSDIKRIPHIPDNSHYSNMYKFRFEVPLNDKYLLESKAREAYKLLVA